MKNEQQKRKLTDCTSFDEIYDSVRSIIESGKPDVDSVREALTSPHLSYDERVFLGKWIEQQAPDLRFDVNLTLAKACEFFYGEEDNFSSALAFYQKAVAEAPHRIEPYKYLAESYDPNTGLPQPSEILAILKEGLRSHQDPRPLYTCLALMYEKLGDAAMATYYKKKSTES
ncbi:MAG: hypothetical protein GXO82_03215 [Chlorobi bacterium]|nr:hypothetical protein [Chlorobiota bacterium]